MFKTEEDKELFLMFFNPDNFTIMNTIIGFGCLLLAALFFRYVIDLFKYNTFNILKQRGCRRAEEHFDVCCKLLIERLNRTDEYSKTACKDLVKLIGLWRELTTPYEIEQIGLCQGRRPTKVPILNFYELYEEALKASNASSAFREAHICYGRYR